MKKSEIKEMADAYVNKHSNLSGIEKSFIFDGYVTGVIEVLQKLGVTVEADNHNSDMF